MVNELDFFSTLLVKLTIQIALTLHSVISLFSLLCFHSKYVTKFKDPYLLRTIK